MIQLQTFKHIYLKREGETDRQTKTKTDRERQRQRERETEAGKGLKRARGYGVGKLFNISFLEKKESGTREREKKRLVAWGRKSDISFYQRKALDERDRGREREEGRERE